MKIYTFSVAGVFGPVTVGLRQRHPVRNSVVPAFSWAPYSDEPWCLAGVLIIEVRLNLFVSPLTDGLTEGSGENLVQTSCPDVKFVAWHSATIPLWRVPPVFGPQDLSSLSVIITDCISYVVFLLSATQVLRSPLSVSGTNYRTTTLRVVYASFQPFLSLCLWRDRHHIAHFNNRFFVTCFINCILLYFVGNLVRSIAELYGAAANGCGRSSWRCRFIRRTRRPFKLHRLLLQSNLWAHCLSIGRWALACRLYFIIHMSLVMAIGVFGEGLSRRLPLGRRQPGWGVSPLAAQQANRTDVAGTSGWRRATYPNRPRRVTRLRPEVLATCFISAPCAGWRRPRGRHRISLFHQIL